jgi:hypothetical protein
MDKANRNIGETQFIISGSPKLDFVICFGHEVLPRIRAKQRKALAHA